jgi:hypothetical protein
MPGPVLTITSVMTCPHGGQVSIAPGSARVSVLGQPVATMADQYLIAGCPFQVPIGTGTKPQPCIRIQYTVPATRVTSMGQPLVLATSTGLCLSAEQIPQGAPIPVTIQPRVIAT